MIYKLVPVAAKKNKRFLSTQQRKELARGKTGVATAAAAVAVAVAVADVGAVVEQSCGLAPGATRASRVRWVFNVKCQGPFQGKGSCISIRQIPMSWMLGSSASVMVKDITQLNV